MKYGRVWPAFVFLGLVLAAAPGCKGAPASRVDADKAREVLRTTLTAWQKGESADSLRQQFPSITAADPKWKEGHRLVRFEIADTDQVVGYDLQCRVVLVLQDPKGKQTEEKAVYTVSTSPALVVIRGEG
jgi:hypothetical protein